ncbi:MAG: hypothetical protein AAGA56_17725, partial [Myxococcota bacterium]
MRSRVGQLIFAAAMSSGCASIVGFEEGLRFDRDSTTTTETASDGGAGGGTDAGGGPPVVSSCGPGTVAFRDNFDDGFDQQLWFYPSSLDEGWLSFETGQAVSNFPIGPGSRNTRLSAEREFSLRDRAVHVELIQAPAAGSGVSFAFNLFGPFNNQIADQHDFGILIMVENDEIRAWFFDGLGTPGFNVDTPPYDPVQHRWFRIRHSVDRIFWEASPDGVTYS